MSDTDEYITCCQVCGPLTIKEYIDDVVTGDTVCMNCGLIIDRACMLTNPSAYEIGNYYEAGDPQTHQPIIPDAPAKCEDNYDDSGITMEAVYDSLLKQISRYSTHIDRRNIVIIRTLCMRVITQLPTLSVKKPAILVLSVYVVYTVPEGAPRGITRLSKDNEFTAMCSLLGVRPSSIASTIRTIQKCVDDNRYRMYTGRIDY
jgi:hypothetical protein